MHRFKNILYYVAPDEEPGEALGHAFALARRNDCPLQLLAVVEPMSRLVSRVIAGSINLEAIIADNQRDALDRFAADPRAEGLDVTTRLRRGRPFLEIIHEVHESGHDLVVKSAQGDATSGGSLGPTALHLMRKCPCPVWVIRPQTAKFKRIVAAVDPGQEDASQAQFQRRIVELANSLADTYGADLSVVHAWQLPGESLLGRRMRAEEFQEALAAARDTSRQNLEALIADSTADPDSVSLIKGFHGQAVADYLRDTNADLAVIGTLSRTGLPGLLIGNTAERILKGLDCSVLAIKPEGFVSPVPIPETAAATVT